MDNRPIYFNLSVEEELRLTGTLDGSCILSVLNEKDEAIKKSERILKQMTPIAAASSDNKANIETVFSMLDKDFEQFTEFVSDVGKGTFISDETVENVLMTVLNMRETLNEVRKTVIEIDYEIQNFDENMRIFDGEE